MSRVHIAWVGVIAIAVAGLLALSLIGVAKADEANEGALHPTTPEQRDNAQRSDNPLEREDQSRAGEIPSGPAASDYLMELKKCEQAPPERQTLCIVSARQKYGQM